MRARSKALLGNRDSVEVAVAVGASADGLVNATDLARQIGIENNRVRAQLLALVKAGMLSEAGQGAGKRWYQRREHEYWETCDRLIEAWSKDFAKTQRAQAVIGEDER